MGGVFARGLLRAGYPIQPVTRNDSIQLCAISEPAMVLVAVGEDDLHPVLTQIPKQWHNRLVLLQNELLPRDWKEHGLVNPTIISVWFEKKPGREFREIIPSPLHGPHAQIISKTLDTLGLSTRILASEQELLQELVLKNLYILTTNIAGLKFGGTVAELWEHHQPFARTIANEVIDLQQWLTGETLNREALIEGMAGAFDGDPTHHCMGRSAPNRLQRALRLAEEAGIELPEMNKLSAL